MALVIPMMLLPETLAVTNADAEIALVIEMTW